MSFIQLNLHPKINKALADCGYTKPTPIQARSIPDILLGKDIVASAQTGTGKTAAFVLPILDKLTIQASPRKTRILILTPTRELATQITQAVRTYGHFLPINTVNLVGGMSYHNQIKELTRGADIIVATPGRLLDHIERKRVDLSHIDVLVLDEADRMLDMGFIDDVEYIARLTPSQRQTLMFSATFDKKLSGVVRRIFKGEPVRIDLSQEKTQVPQIKQELYKVQNAQHKFRMLKHFLGEGNMFKAIIFSATKVNADKLAIELRQHGLEAAALHGDLKQNVRNRTLEQLRRGKIQCLVATDVAARGIDVNDITHVINYDLPRFCEDYVHRIGRTGRAGKTGVAISFVLPTDMRHVRNIERYIGQSLKLLQHGEVAETTGHAVRPMSHTDDRENDTHVRRSRGNREKAPRGRGREDRERAPHGRGREDRERAPHGRGREDKERSPHGRGREDRERAPHARGREDRERAPHGRGREDRERAPHARGREDRERAPHARGREDRERSPRARGRGEDRERAPYARSRDDRERAPHVRGAGNEERATHVRKKHFEEKKKFPSHKKSNIRSWHAKKEASPFQGEKAGKKAKGEFSSKAPKSKKGFRDKGRGENQGRPFSSHAKRKNKVGDE